MKEIKVFAAFLAVLAMSGCEQSAQIYQPKPGDGRHVSVFHDDGKGVTCWLYGGTNGGISCIPDWMLDRGAVEPESLEGME